MCTIYYIFTYMYIYFCYIIRIIHYMKGFWAVLSPRGTFNIMQEPDSETSRILSRDPVVLGIRNQELLNQVHA